MASICKLNYFVVVLALVLLLGCTLEAASFTRSSSGAPSSEDFFHRLDMSGIKGSGPSPRGGGHERKPPPNERLRDSNIFEARSLTRSSSGEPSSEDYFHKLDKSGIKRSGPSPGPPEVEMEHHLQK